MCRLTIIKMNSNYFPKYINQLILVNWEAVFVVCGGKSIFMCYAHEFEAESG